MRELESSFYGRLRDRCKSLRFKRVENALDSGFPDALVIWRGHITLAEFKAEYVGGHVYVRDTQMSSNMQLLEAGVDLPILTGTLDKGFWIAPYSSFLKIPHQQYKDGYKRFNSKDFVMVPGQFIPQRSDWDAILVPILFNYVYTHDKMDSSREEKA